MIIKVRTIGGAYYWKGNQDGKCDTIDTRGDTKILWIGLGEGKLTITTSKVEPVEVLGEHIWIGEGGVNV